MSRQFVQCCEASSVIMRGEWGLRIGTSALVIARFVRTILYVIDATDVEYTAQSDIVIICIQLMLGLKRIF